MSRFSFGSLRVRLVLLVLLAVVPPLGQMVYHNFQHRRESSTEVQQEALRLVRIVAGEHERFIASAKQLLITLAQLQVVRESDLTACQSLFADLQAQYPYYSGITLVNLDGEVNCSSSPIVSPVSFADRPWFQKDSTGPEFCCWRLPDWTSQRQKHCRHGISRPGYVQ